MKTRFTFRGVVATVALAMMTGAIGGLVNLNVQHYAKGTPLEAILDLLRPMAFWLKQATTDPRFLVLTALLVGGTLFLWTDAILRRWSASRDTHKRINLRNIDRKLLAMTLVLFFAGGLLLSLLWLAVEARIRPQPKIAGPLPPSAEAGSIAAAPPPSPDQQARREFTDRTPGEVLALFEGRTMFQANQLIEPLKGKWIKAEGSIMQIIPNGPPGASTLVLRDGSKTISCNIGSSWAPRVIKLNTGDQLKVNGKLYQFQNGQQLYLEECEIVD